MPSAYINQTFYVPLCILWLSSPAVQLFIRVIRDIRGQKFFNEHVLYH
jgi:hypothetical protein